MKQQLQKILMLLVFSLAAVSANALELDGNTYDIKTNSTGKVYASLYRLKQDYTGDFVLPSNVTYQGVTYPVLEIGEAAFESCTGLTSVTLHDSVQFIGYGPFFGCSSLKDIKVASSNPYFTDKDGVLFTKDMRTLVTYPGGRSGNYEIPSSVTSIGWGAFDECTSLTGVSIPNSVTFIDDYAFTSCYGLTSLTIPNSVISIGECAFGDCFGLTSVDFSNAMTSIGESAFDSCKGLRSVKFSKYINSIGKFAFSECSSLTDIDLSGISSWLSIDNYAFGECISLQNVSLPGTLTSVGSGIFSGCRSLQNIKVGTTNASFADKDGVLFTKDMSTLIAYPGGRKGGYVIPETVTTISDYAFSVCGGLTSVSIPDQVDSIGVSAFGGCTGLTSVTLPSSLTSISERAFFYTGLTSVAIPHRVTSIAKDAFLSCRNLTKMSLSSSLQEVGYDNFHTYINTNLKEVYSHNTTPPNLGLQKYDTLTFKATLYVPKEAVEAYKNSEWKRFAAIVGIDFSPKTVEIGDFAFNMTMSDFAEPSCGVAKSTEYNPDMGDVTIPSKITYEGITYPVTRIEDNGFSECHGMTSLVIPSSVTSIGSWAFSSCDGLTSVTIPNTVTTIKSGAFCGCEKLETLQLPDKLTCISAGLFMYCYNLKKITLPASVDSIVAAAFHDCNNLTEVISLNPTPPTYFIAGSSFTLDPFTNYNATLYVPQEAVDKYKSTYPWSGFANIVGGNFSGISATPTDDFSISVDGGSLKIKGDKIRRVSLYDISGRKVYGNDKYAGENISVQRGLYILKTGSCSMKVQVK